MTPLPCGAFSTGIRGRSPPWSSNPPRATWGRSTRSPGGPAYQAGTLSGNPLAVAAGIAALTELSKKDTYRKLAEKSDYLGEGLTGGVRTAGGPPWTNRFGGGG